MELAFMALYLTKPPKCRGAATTSTRIRKIPVTVDDLDVSVSGSAQTPRGPPMSTGESTQIVGWVERLKGGDNAAFDELLIYFEERLLRLTRKRLKAFPAVGRWEQTDDVFQAAAMRLRKALKGVTPRSTREFYGLAALQVRRELLNMNAVYRNRLAPSQVGRMSPGDRSSSGAEPGDPVDDREGPRELEAWTEFHEVADALPEEIREVFQQIFYLGVTQAELAVVLGVSERTIRSRWQEARLMIHRALEGRLPGI
jgi:RNA polymerase sigma factor (sigma-70 family)